MDQAYPNSRPACRRARQNLQPFPPPRPPLPQQENARGSSCNFLQDGAVQLSEVFLQCLRTVEFRSALFVCSTELQVRTALLNQTLQALGYVRRTLPAKEKSCVVLEHFAVNQRIGR